MDGSSLLFRAEGADGSQLTSQTSLASFSTLYSMSSIYQLNSDSQLELNTEFPLGEGNFGVVYKGVMSRSNGEWDQVRLVTVHTVSHTYVFFPLSFLGCRQNAQRL